MGAENSKDGENTEQTEAEGSPGSEKGTPESRLPNGDVGTSLERLDGAPDGQTPEEEPKESPDVDEHTKRMTIISENIYHYVGVVSGREYAREKGLLPTKGEVPTAPEGFLRPQKKKKDAKGSDRKMVGEPPKPTKDEKLPKETLDAEKKEVDSQKMKMPRFYQSSNADKHKATEKSGISDSPNVHNDKIDGKKQEKDDRRKVEKMVSKPEKDDDSSKMELPLFYQSDKHKTAEEPNKSESRNLPKGETDGKTEKHKDKERVEKQSKDALESKPERNADTPSVELPRFYQSPSEDKKKVTGESGKTESPNVSNGKTEGKTREKDVKENVKKVESKPEKEANTPAMKLLQLDINNTAGKSVQSEFQNVSNGETKSKTNQKNEKLENKADKENGSPKMELPRFYPAGNTEDKKDGISKITPSAEKAAASSEPTSQPEADSDATPKRYTIAMTVGPRKRKIEDPKWKKYAVEKPVAVDRAKSDEGNTKPIEPDVEERTVQNEEQEEQTPHEDDILGSQESSDDTEPNTAQLNAAEEKEKSVRFEGSIDESTTPPTERKRIVSMIYVASRRDLTTDDPTVNAAPPESTPTPPLKPAESNTGNEDDHQDDLISLGGEELKLTTKRVHLKDSSDEEDDTVSTTPAPGQEKRQPQLSDTPGIPSEDRGPVQNSEYDVLDTGKEVVTLKAASSLYSSTPLGQSLRQRIQEVEEGAPDYEVHHLKQPVPRSPEVNLGSGKILNAPSILMASSITSSTNRQMCELLPQDTLINHVDPRTSSLKIKLAPKEVKTKPSKLVVKLNTGAVSPEDSTDSGKAPASDDVQTSKEPLVMYQPSDTKSTCDSCTQTPDVLYEDQSPGARAVRSRSVGFQCKAGDPERKTATQTRSSLPSVSRSVRPPDAEKKTKIPLASRSAHPEVSRLSKSSPLPERKTNLTRKDTSTAKSSPKAAVTNEHRNPKKLEKSRSVPAQNSPSCLGHSVTSKAAASPRVVQKKDDNKTPLHATSKSMESIPRCTCLQLPGKDSLHGEKKMSRPPANPLGLREYGFTPPSNKPHWR